MSDQRDPRSYSIIGAAMEVHRTLGAGFLEPVYQEALAIEFAEKGVPFQAQAAIPVGYKGRTLATSYRVDFMCFDTVIVEIKALARLSGTEEAQLINYLKASRLELGLLINFGAQRLEYRRFVLSLCR